MELMVLIELHVLILIIITHLAGELKDFNIEDHIDKKEARRMDRFTQYAVVAAREAVQDAKLDINDDTADRIGVWIGSGIGGMETFETAHTTLVERGPRRVSPFFVPMLIPDMATGQVSIDLGAKGPNGSTVTACATGTNSIGEAFKVIQRGDADAMITGGTEAPITDMAIADLVQVVLYLQMMIKKPHVVHSKKVVMALLWVKAQESLS